jgi:hypothetical protein
VTPPALKKISGRIVMPRDLFEIHLWFSLNGDLFNKISLQEQRLAGAKGLHCGGEEVM